MSIVAIVQARLGSTRLPGKVLRELHGRPMLARVLERLRMAKSIDEIVLAIPDSQQDDALATFARQWGCPVFQGSEQDVLLRYRDAARAFGAEHVVRVTSDCPLIDPAVVDRVVSAHLRDRKKDYTSNVLTRSYPRGMDTEVISRFCLERVERETGDPVHREHVTNWILDNQQLYEVANVARPAGDRSDLRVCVDTLEDAAVIEAILKGTNEATDIEQVIAFLDRHPAIARGNASVHQVQKTERPHAS